MRNRAAWAEIDLGALQHNYREIKTCLADGAKFCAVVKANAYGHGAVECARMAVLEGAEYLAVATISEGIELRAAGIRVPILILGLVLPNDAKSVVEFGFTQTVSSLPLAQALSIEAQAQRKIAKIHLKVETGMGRIGVRPEKIVEFARAVRALPAIEIEGIFSHFASADSKDKTFAKEQLAAFQTALDALRDSGIGFRYRHIAESAAILDMPEAHYDMVRAGVIQYGMWPSNEVQKKIKLRPVMRLCAKVVYLKDVHPGETIGYGRSWTAKRESLIATLPLGYADGYIRAYGKAKSYVLIRGEKAPVVGRVCMDQFMVDVTDIEGVTEGDLAIIFGPKELSVDRAAKWLDTINYEVTCLISERIPRVYYMS